MAGIRSNIQNMAASSLSSSDEKLVALDSLEDGPSEVMRIRDQEAEIYSFIGQLNHSQNEKGKQIMSDFDETIRGKVATTMNLDAESSRMAMAHITNLETKILTHQELKWME